MYIKPGTSTRHVRLLLKPAWLSGGNRNGGERTSSIIDQRQYDHKDIAEKHNSVPRSPSIAIGKATFKVHG